MYSHTTPQHTYFYISCSYLHRAGTVLENERDRLVWAPPPPVAGGALATRSVSGSSLRPTWCVHSEGPLSRSLADGCTFVLRLEHSSQTSPGATAGGGPGQQESVVSLLCTVRRLPECSLVEQRADYKADRFVLKARSETSV